MKFNSFIESLKEKDNSKFSDNQLSTDVICIDQISHPINNDRRKLFYKYAEANGVIQKFNNIVIGEIVNFTEKKSVAHFEYKKGTEVARRIRQHGTRLSATLVVPLRGMFAKMEHAISAVNAEV